MVKQLLLFSILFIALVFWLNKSEQNLGFGETIGNIIRSSWIYHNGVFTYAYSIPLVTGNVPCAIKSPESTSTIVHASISIRTSTSSANFVEIAKSPNSTATTTSLGILSIPANGYGELVASSSLHSADNWIIAPNNYFVAKYSQGYSNVPAGNCEVIFRVIN